MWYKSGTITVTNGSTTVTGSGTQFIANVAIGEALYAPDGRLYEITNVASDTAFTISPAYLGATAAGQNYTIVPSQSYIRDLAAQAADLVNNYSTIANFAGQGKFGDGTVSAPGIRFSDDLDTGIYRIGSNNLGIAAGGTKIVDVTTSGISVTGTINGTTIPTSKTLVDLDSAQTLTNKTLTSPAINTPTISGGTINNTPIGGTTPNTGAFTSLTSSSTTTLNGTTIPASATLTKTTDKLNVFAATTSAELAGVISDETGTGALVFAGSPALTGTPTAPTAAAGTNTTQLATTAHVFAERTNTATLTNKTLTSPAINTPTISGGTINNTPIGGTTPNTGAFTNLSYTGTLTGGTGVINIGSGQLYKDASGNVGFGTTTPNPNAWGKAATIQGVSSAAFEVTDGTVRTSLISAAGSAGFLSVETNHPLIIRTNSAERMRIDALGTLILNQGQIQFPATQVASSNANTLDDYEEGTFTPTLEGNSAVTYNAQSGSYTKIGNMVIVKIAISLSAWTGTGAAVNIANLPFVAFNISANLGSNACLIDQLSNDANAVIAQMNPSLTIATILRNCGKTGAHGALAGTEVTSSSVIRATLVYQVA